MRRSLLIGFLTLLGFPALASAGFYAPPAADTNPVWSPDGSVIVYYRAYSGLRVVNPDGSGDRLLSGVPNSSNFAFSKDWHWLALPVYEAPGLAAITVMRPDGSESRIVGHGTCCTTPAFSPDGTRVAFARDGGIWISDLNGGEPALFAAVGADPTWAPGGQQLAYTVSTLTGLHVVLNALDGSAVWDIGTFYFGAAQTGGASWSQNGRLAFIVGSPMRIATYDFKTNMMKAFRVGSAANLEWSNDGATILFSDAHGLSKLDSVTGAVSPVANGAFGALSPVSSDVAYSGTGECGDRAGIYVGERRITNSCRVFGTERADRLTASNKVFQIVMGLGGDDTLIARGAPYVGDALEGGDGNDRLIGALWHDKLSGDGGDDLITGGPNSDTLTGGAGHDVLYGQGGRDTLFARDNEPDLVDCGTNTGKTNKAKEDDRAYVDRFDLVVHCEHVFFRPR